MPGLRNLDKAEAIFRRDLSVLRLQKAQLEQQQKNIAEQIARIETSIGECLEVLTEDSGE